MANTIQVPITLSPEQKEKAKEISKKILGRQNISGLFQYWIANYEDGSHDETEELINNN